jgi:hypothetical protein
MAAVILAALPLHAGGRVGETFDDTAQHNNFEGRPQLDALLEGRPYLSADLIAALLAGKTREDFLADLLRIQRLIQQPDKAIEALRPLEERVSAIMAESEAVDDNPKDAVTALEQAFTELEDANYFPRYRAVALDVLTPGQFATVISDGLILNDIGPSLEHGEYAHRLQWAMIMNDFRNNPSEWKNPPFVNFTLIGKVDIAIIIHNATAAPGTGWSNLWGSLLDNAGYLTAQVTRTQSGVSRTLFLSAKNKRSLQIPDADTAFNDANKANPAVQIAHTATDLFPDGMRFPDRLTAYFARPRGLYNPASGAPGQGFDGMVANNVRGLLRGTTPEAFNVQPASDDDDNDAVTNISAAVTARYNQRVLGAMAASIAATSAPKNEARGFNDYLNGIDASLKSDFNVLIAGPTRASLAIHKADQATFNFERATPQMPQLRALLARQEHNRLKIAKAGGSPSADLVKERAQLMADVAAVLNSDPAKKVTLESLKDRMTPRKFSEKNGVASGSKVSFSELLTFDHDNFLALSQPLDNPLLVFMADDVTPESVLAAAEDRLGLTTAGADDGMTDAEDGTKTVKKKKKKKKK